MDIYGEVGKLFLQGGIIISRSKKMLLEALSSLEEEKSWPLLSNYSKSSLIKLLIGMHYKLEEAARKKKIQINNNLPRELSLTLSPISKAGVSKHVQISKAVILFPHMLHQSWFEPPPLEAHYTQSHREFYRSQVISLLNPRDEDLFVS